MSDPKASTLWHVILTPADLQALGGKDNLHKALSGELPLEVCHMEPVGADRAQELMELFARMPAQSTGSCHTGNSDGSCPICSPEQRDLVAEAVQRALRR